MKRKPRVYFASKLHHAERWQRTVIRWPEIEFTSTWIYNTPEMERNATGEDFTRYWITDLNEVMSSDFVLCYMKDDDVLKGALVEAGCILGCGKMVLAVGLPHVHSWTYHPRVLRLSRIWDALDFITHKEFTT